MDRCWGPIGGPPGQTVRGRLALMIDGLGCLGEGGPVFEAIHVDDPARPGSGVADRADIHAAALADQECGGARAEPVMLDERPILRADIDRAVRIARGARAMGAAE